MAGDPHVLVVDDDPAIRLLCRINLQMDGFGVTEAATLGDARDALGSGSVDVVLLDVHVGAGDGREFLSELRRDHPEVAVAMLTGSSDRESLRALDPDALVGKPFTLDELRGTVERLAGTRR